MPSMSSLMGGANEPGRTPPDADLATMMHDLGLARVEELARDETCDRFAEHNRSAAKALAARPIEPTDQRAMMWRNAIDQGDFEDDDFRQVQHLDPLDGGNAHRLNRLQRQGHERDRTFEARLNLGSGGSEYKFPKYDPFNPSRYGKRRPPKVHEQKRDPVTGISSLGGLIPPGGEVKRWEAGQGERRTIPDGRTKGTPDQHQHHVTDGRAKAARGWLDLPQGVISNAERAYPPKSPAGAQAPTVQLPRPTTPNASPLPIECRSSVLATSTTLSVPHVRIASEVAPETPQVIAPEVTGPKNVNTGAQYYLFKNTTPPPAEGPVGIQRTSLPAREIFFKSKVLSPIGPMTHCWVFLYEVSEKNTCLWELHIKGGGVARDDIRQFLAPKIGKENGRVVVFVQCLDGERGHHETLIKTTPLYFESDILTQEFTKELQRRMSQFASSNEPILHKSGEIMKQNLYVSSDSPKLEQEKRYGGACSTPNTLAANTPQIKEAPLSLLTPSPKPQPEEGSLIDITESSIKFDTNPLTSKDSSHHELEGLQYPALATDTSKGGPIVGQKRLPPTYSDICPDVASIDSIAAGKDLSQESSRILCRIETGGYTEMISSYTSLVELFNTALSFPEDNPVIKPAAAQIASLHLTNDPEFSGLSESDKKKTIAVVYRNILNRTSKTTWLPRDLLSLRPSQAISCPREVLELNAFNESRHRKKNRSLHLTLPSPQPSLYSPKIVQQRAEKNDQFLHGSERQSDPKLPYPLGMGSSQVAEATDKITDSYPASAWDFPTPRPGAHNYTTSPLPMTPETPTASSYVPRGVSAQSKQSESLKPSQIGTEKGLAASRWNKSDASPSGANQRDAQAPARVSSHQPSASNVSTRSTMSRLAMDMALLQVNDCRRS